MAVLFFCAVINSFRRPRNFFLTQRWLQQRHFFLLWVWPVCLKKRQIAYQSNTNLSAQLKKQSHWAWEERQLKHTSIVDVWKWKECSEYRYFFFSDEISVLGKVLTVKIPKCRHGFCGNSDGDRFDLLHALFQRQKKCWSHPSFIQEFHFGDSDAEVEPRPWSI